MTSMSKAPQSESVTLSEFAVGDVTFVAIGAPAVPGDVAKRLAPSELEVLRMIIQGMTNAEIAAARNTAVRTTANQVAIMFKKLGVSSRGELLARVDS